MVTCLRVGDIESALWLIATSCLAGSTVHARSAGKDERAECAKRADTTGRFVGVVRHWPETQGEIHQARHATFTPYATSNSGRRAARASPITSNTRRALQKLPIRHIDRAPGCALAAWATGFGGHVRTWMCALSASGTCRRSRCGPQNPVARAAESAPRATDLDQARTPKSVRSRPSPISQARPTSTTPEHLNASPYCRASFRAFRLGSPLTSASNPPLSSSASMRRASTGFANR